MATVNTKMRIYMLNSWLFFLLVLIGIALLFMWTMQRAQDRLQRWATAQGYAVIRISKPPFMRLGPFPLQHPHGHAIACLVVHNGDQGERMGWVRYPAGLALFGPGDLTDVELIWDDEWERKQLSRPKDKRKS